MSFNCVPANLNAVGGGWIFIISGPAHRQTDRALGGERLRERAKLRKLLIYTSWTSERLTVLWVKLSTFKSQTSGHSVLLR